MSMPGVAVGQRTSSSGPGGGHGGSPGPVPGQHATNLREAGGGRSTATPASRARAYAHQGVAWWGVEIMGKGAAMPCAAGVVDYGTAGA